MKAFTKAMGIALLLTMVAGSVFVCSTTQIAFADTTNSSVTADDSIDTWMPDKALQKTVYDALHDLSQSANTNGGYDTTEISQITPVMLADLRYLHVNTTDITDLSGLQYATGLIQADFSGNTITKVPDKMPGTTDSLYSLGLGNYALTADSPDWVLSSKVNFTNTTKTYTDLNYGFAGESISGTYTLKESQLKYSDDKTSATIPFSVFFKGFKQSDGTYADATPTVSIKYSSTDDLKPVVNTDKKQIELDLSKVTAATTVQIQFSVNASTSGASYATWNTLKFNVPEPDKTVTDPMDEISPSEVGNITQLSKDNSNVVSSKVDALENYMKNTMMTDTGIYSGYMTEAEKADADTDSDMFNQITESSGLYLEILAMQGDATAFDNYYAQVKKTFSNDDGSFYWMYNTRTKDRKPGNASLDDLRIMRALTMMQAKSPSDARAVEIKKLTAGFKKYSLLDGKMIDGTSFTDGTKEPAIRLSYLDMQELKYIYGIGGWSQADYDAQLKTLKGGYLGDDFPWYQTYYYYGDMNGYKKGEYSTLPEAKGEVNAIDSLLVILHLAQIGQAKPASISWVKAHVHDRTLYNNYYTDGTPVEKNSAASSYAIAAMIASTVGDKDMYNDCVQDLNDSQVGEGYGDFSGCLGDIPSKKSATYNNLTGLLSYYY